MTKPAAGRSYLDANATIPPLDAAIAAAERALRDLPGNPSSPHAEGRHARAAVEDAREVLAALVGGDPRDLTFTSGGSEALNMAVHGAVAAWHARHPGATTPPWIVASAGEHPAVAQAVAAQAADGRARPLRLATDALGRVDPATLDAALAAAPDQTALVAVIAAHNETGATQNLAALHAVVAAHGAALLLDGVQWTGKLPIDLRVLPGAAWALSAHKFGGIKGVGALLAPPGMLQTALIHGGPQERRRRAGTENVPGIVAAAAAAALAAREGDAWRTAWRGQLERLRQALQALWPAATWLHDAAGGLPQTLLVRIPGWIGSELVQRLDLDGVAVSTGSACSSGAVRGSEALAAMGAAADEARGFVRFSLPPRLPDADLARAIAALTAIAAERR